MGNTSQVLELPLQVAVRLFSVRYIIKVDDDSYVRLDRLAVAVGQWQAFGAGAQPYGMFSS